MASDYPDTAFLMGSSGEAAGDNFGVFGTWNWEAAYLAGMLAGEMTQSGMVGSVGAIPIPEVNMLINGFADGVKAVNPDAEHIVSFIGTFFDPPKAREAGLAQIDGGADILFGERIGTADAAQERGIKAIGSLIDYTPRYPDTVFANALWSFRPLLDAALADATGGNRRGQELHAAQPDGRRRQRHRLRRRGGPGGGGGPDGRDARGHQGRRVRGAAQLRGTGLSVVPDLIAADHRSRPCIGREFGGASV